MAHLTKPEYPLQCERDYVILPALADDIGYIVDTWASSYRDSAQAALVDQQIYKTEVRGAIAELLGTQYTAVARPRAHVDMDGRPAKASDILGWVCYGFDKKTFVPVVWYSYVRAPFRLHGIFDNLLHRAAGVAKGSVFMAGFHTRVCRSVLPHYPACFYNPFLAFYVQSVGRIKGYTL